MMGEYHRNHLTVALSLVTITMVLQSLCLVAQADRLSSHSALPPASSDAGEKRQHKSDGYTNLENLISDLLDDAGNRLKKSRQIKQTLRFGRSDPSMSPSLLKEQIALERERDNNRALDDEESLKYAGYYDRFDNANNDEPSARPSLKQRLFQRWVD